MNSIKIVILAAGKGTRLASLGFNVPKPLIPIHGRPMISYLFDAIKKSGVDQKPILVVAPDNKELFEKEFGDAWTYVVQDKQLGTGHAVLSACEAFSEAQNVMVINGDHSTVSAETIRRLAEEHESSHQLITMGTVRFPDFDDWRQWFFNFGRIIRDQNGQIKEIVELKCATDEQKNITEVNPTYFVFNKDWLCQHLESLRDDNAQKEYLLTDLIGFAFKEKVQIHSFVIEDPIEAIGVNTPEQLKAAEEALTNRD